MHYPIEHFCLYSAYVIDEMVKRGYNIREESVRRFFECLTNEKKTSLTFDEMFKGWHNERYLIQCLLNLQEKYDCGGITEEEWKIINDDNWMYLDDDIIINNLGR
jgi:hypothetical protein